MSQTETSLPAADAKGQLLHARTHMKILIKPLMVQILMLALHWACWNYLPVVTDFIAGVHEIGESIARWMPWVIHGVILLIEIIYVVVPVLHWWHARFVITPEQTKMSWGLATRRTREVQLERITQVEMERSLIDHLFGSGTIYLHVAGSDAAVEFHDVPRVKQAKAILDELIHTPR